MNNLTEKKRMELGFSRFRELGLLFFIIVISVLVQFRNSNFFTLENIDDLITNTVILSILSIGMMLVIITRGIDLSIGSTVALTGMVSAMVISRYQELSPLLAILIGIAIGVTCGFIIGLLISKASVLPIIATLGMMEIYRGLTYLISGSRWVSAHQMPVDFKAIGTAKFLGLKAMIFIPIIIYIVVYFYINHMKSGRQIYAVGSNPESAVISGIKTDRVLIRVYTIMGALAGLAGVLWVAKYASAQGNTAAGYEMNVIAACVLGGVSIAGGTGKISGLLLGTLLIGLLNNALPLINVSPFWQQGIQGVIIMFAVIFNTIVKRNVTRRNDMRRKI